MNRRSGIALLVALVCGLALALTGVLALGVAGVHDADAAILHGFVSLDSPMVHRAMWVLAHLVDPLPYAVAGLILIGVALVRRRGWRALAAVTLLLGTGGTTQVLKDVLADPRSGTWLGSGEVGPTVAEWPSGHSTAAMTLALCAVLVAPVGLRAMTAVAGGLFAAGVGNAVLVLGWHFPSDVVGGFLVAGLWTALAVAALVPLEQRTPEQRTALPRVDVRRMTALGAGVALVAGVVLAAYGSAFAERAAERPVVVVGGLAIAALAGTLSAAFARAA